MTKRKLVLAVTLAAAGSVWVGGASAAEKAETSARGDMPGYELPEIVVAGERTAEMAGGLLSTEARMGILGDVKVLDHGRCQRYGHSLLDAEHDRKGG